MDCPSCYQLFDEKVRIPRNLQCGHTFCEECLLHIEDKNLLLCPICRYALPKQLKATKLPKNFIALEIARKHQEMQEKNKLCANHPKEGLRYFCNTCQLLICAECIFDHSGHEFVRREESGFVIKETAQEILKSIEFSYEETKQMVDKAQDGLKFLESKSNADYEKVDLEMERIIKNVKKRGQQLKDNYMKLVTEQSDNIKNEIENYKNQLSLLDYNKSNVEKILEEMDQTGKVEKHQKNKLENTKKMAESAHDQTKKLKPIQLNFPNIVFCQSDTDRVLRKIGDLSFTSHMKNKRICFFGDTNKVMEYNLNNKKWSIKSLNTHSDFLYYSSSVTLPNGDALIIGGGSSTAVYQYTNKGELIKRKAMNQMRKEHSATILGSIVYVMGGYDGAEGNFLASCELYNYETNKEWKHFAPMKTSKCAFSACVVNKSIYTFGGYDGTKRLDTIEKYSIENDRWEKCSFRLRFALSNCACFSPYMNKVVIFGGGFSSGFSHFVEMVDVESGEWKSLPKMKEGRDLRNKVVYVDGSAYAIGGLNRKCERLNLLKKRWISIDDYVINDNLDSWSCALMFTPQKTFSDKDMELPEDPDVDVPIIIDEGEEEIEMEEDQDMNVILDDSKDEMIQDEPAY